MAGRKKPGLLLAKVVRAAVKGTVKGAVKGTKKAVKDYNKFR